MRVKTKHELSKSVEKMCFTVELPMVTEKNFWCRCAQGIHPFPSRTRRLRLERPMILHWRRCGKAGGCQIHGDIAQLGEHLPCKQGVESSSLFISTMGLQLSRLERTPDKREVGGSSPLKPIEFVRIQGKSISHKPSEER